MQKIQARADLERMVHNYALLGKIDNETADKIVTFIRLVIGNEDVPKQQGKITSFPVEAPVPEKRAKTYQLGAQSLEIMRTALDKQGYNLVLRDTQQ